MGPRKRVRGGVRSAAMAAVSGRVFLFELGELANLTVIGSWAPSGIVPFSSLMAFSASDLWSKRMNPTPLDKPAVPQTLIKIGLHNYGPFL